MKLSIITVFKTPAPGLEKTMDSVRREFSGCPEAEYLIKEWSSEKVDPVNAAGFGSMKVHWWKGPDGGVFEAMNEAAARATGEFLLFLNAGDWLAEGVGEGFFKALEQNPEASYFYGDGVSVDAADGREFYRQAPAKLELKDFLHRAPVLHPSLLVRRSWFSRYFFDVRLSLAADFCQMFSLVAAGQQGVHLGRVIGIAISGGLSQRYRLVGKKQALRFMWTSQPKISFRLRLLHAASLFLLTHFSIRLVNRYFRFLRPLLHRRTGGQPPGTYSNSSAVAKP